MTDDSRPDQLAADANPLIDEDADAQSGAPSAADLAAENAALREQALRYAAEAENTRRRAEREANDARAYAIQKFARDLLGVADNLSRALQHAPREHEDPGVKNLVLGIDMTEKELQGAFERNGLKKVDPQPGARFDPHLHQAMMEEAAPGVPSGCVVRALQAGYELYGRIVRPALVVVAPKAAAEQPAEPSQGGGAYATADGAGAGATLDTRA
jgi:molecular chaperone GrpE